MSRRTERLGSTIRQELATMIQRELNDPRLIGFPSITRVKVAEDLSTADVFVTIMGTPGQQTAALNALKHSAGMMRGRLMKELSIRQTPYLRFQLDEDLKKELEMMELLDKVAKENAEIDRKRAEQAAAEQGAQAEQAAGQPEMPPPAEGLTTPGENAGGENAAGGAPGEAKGEAESEGESAAQ